MPGSNQKIKLLLCSEKRKLAVVMFGSSIVANHYTMTRALRLRIVEAGFVDFNPRQFLPHGRSESLHLSVSMCSREFFGDPDFFHKDDPINLYHDNLNNNYLLASKSVIDRLYDLREGNKTRFEFVEPLTDDPKRFEEALYNNVWEPAGLPKDLKEEA